MLHRRLPRVDLPERTYFITSCLDQRRPLLADPQVAADLIRLFAERRDKGDLRLHGYVVMPDHYHVLLTLRGERSISALVGTVHSLFARRWRVLIGPQERLWQQRFYDHVVRGDEDWQATLTYLHGNPVRAGLVEDSLAYPWSSCRFWETGQGPVACDTP